MFDVVLVEAIALYAVADEVSTTFLVVTCGAALLLQVLDLAVVQIQPEAKVTPPVAE